MGVDPINIMHDLNCHNTNNWVHVYKLFSNLESLKYQ